MDKEISWQLIESYFREDCLGRLVRHHLESYNDFVGIQLNKTIEMFNPVTIKSSDDYDPKSCKYALEIQLEFTNLQIFRPQIHENNGAVSLMLPNEARLRNFTYSSNMCFDLNIKYIVRNGATLENETVICKCIPRVQFGAVPIMLKSSLCSLTPYKHYDSAITNECPLDTGGYFIINGSEKVVLGQERAAENRVYVYYVGKTNTKYTWCAEIKSIPDHKCISPKQINVWICSRTNEYGHPIMVEIVSRFKSHIPLFVVFRALGVLSDKEICDYILASHVPASENSETTEASAGCARSDRNERSEFLELLKASIVDANSVMSQNAAIEYCLGATINKDLAIKLITADLFPHCTTLQQKLYALGYQTRMALLAHTGKIIESDRDDNINKRIDATGASLNNLFRTYFHKLVKDMEKQILKEIKAGEWLASYNHEEIIKDSNIYKIVKSSIIENGFKRALSTGDFSTKTINNNNKVGVAQVLNRLTRAATISHLRRISAPSSDKSGKLIPPRKLHPKSWGVTCPCETPEGQSVGIVKNLSSMTQVTVFGNSVAMHEIIAKSPRVVKFSDADNLGKKMYCPKYLDAKVMVNGCWVGWTAEPYELYKELKQMKLCGILNVYTSVVFDYTKMEVRISNSSGRYVRPLIRLYNGKSLLTQEIMQKLVNCELKWEDLFLEGEDRRSILEYLDVEEEEYAKIALRLEHATSQDTHSEIHESTILGILASCIPLPDHNQSPRNTYQCAMAKQAMGWALTMPRMEKTGYEQSTVMRPLVETRLSNILKFHELPAGNNITVAIMSHSGYNQEDSLLVNAGSVRRGLFQVTVIHTEKDEEKQKNGGNGNDKMRCKPPPKTCNMKLRANYDKIDPITGLMPENTLVNDRDIIIAKVVPLKPVKGAAAVSEYKYEDQSIMYSTTEEVYVDKTYTNTNEDGITIAKVRLRTLRQPDIGDKFSSRHGQKGTTGNLVAEEDMPYLTNGVRPDFIINPHAIPSRMTLGHMEETLMGKVLAELGVFGDGTPFDNLSVDVLSKKLLELGFEAHGNDLLYDGESGKQIECAIYVGPIFYQRLKHMTADKRQSRATGPCTMMTRQPTEGKARNGGLKVGAMENDCIHSHGMTAFSRDRLMTASDKYEVFICQKCGQISAFNAKKHIYMCKGCDNTSDFARVEIPYANKLIKQELATTNISMQYLTAPI